MQKMGFVAQRQRNFNLLFNKYLEYILLTTQWTVIFYAMF